LEHIATAEGLDVSPEVIQTLISTSQGDLRRAITYLQSAARLNVAGASGSTITPRDIQEIAGVVPDGVINSFAATIGVDVSGEEGMEIDGGQFRGFDLIRKKVKELMREGYSAAQLLTQVCS
jgi:replication factor C subunit 2/4